MNDFQRHKKSDKIKWIVTGLAIFLIAVTLVGLCLQLFGKGKAKPSEWFNKNEQKQEQVIQNGQSGLVSPEEVEMNGLKITAKTISAPMYEAYGAPRGAEAALTLTVTPTPADAELTGAKFTIAFKNASSAWATGKTVTEYVTLSQSNEKAATVSCLKAFGEPIVITYTVTGEKGESKSATYQLDYRARIDGVRDFSINQNGDLSEEPGLSFSDLQTQMEITFVYTDYTIKEDFNFSPTSNISLSQDFIQKCQEKSLILPQTQFTLQPNSEKRFDKEYEVDILLNGIEKLWGETEYKTQAFRDVLVDTYQSLNQFLIKIEITDGYTTFKLDGYFSLEIDSLPKAVQSVQFADGSQHTF